MERIKWGRLIAYMGAVLVLVVGFQNCGPEHQLGSSTTNGGSSQGGLTDAQYAALETEVIGILNTRCASCHTSLAGGSNLPYLNSGSISNLKFDQIYVKRGSPQTSAVYLAIIDGQMPPGSNLVNSAPQDVFKIRDWIQYMR